MTESTATIRCGAVLACVIGSIVGPAARGVEPVLRTLLEATDAVVHGAVEGVTSAPGGVWYSVGVRDTLRGEVPAATLLLYAHGAGVPESVELVPGDEAIIGVRWLASEAGPFHARLLESLGSDGDRGRAGLLAPDGVMAISPADRDEVLQLVRGLVGAGGSERIAAGDAVRDLLASDRAAMRVEALRRVAMMETITNDVRRLIRDALAAEIGGDRDGRVLQAFLDTIRIHEIDGCHESLCEAILTGPDPAILAESIDALARTDRDAGLRLLLSQLPRSRPAARCRILRALGGLGWQGTAHLSRQCLEGDDPALHAAAVDTLGRLPDLEATALLEEVVDHASAGLRGLAIDALIRQLDTRTPWSRDALRRTLEKAQPDEKERIRRALSSAAGRVLKRRILHRDPLRAEPLHRAREHRRTDGEAGTD